jgi:hypothetical protein
MPRTTYRKHTLEQMQLRVNKLHRDYLLREIDEEDDSDEDDIYLYNRSILRKMKKKRYFYREKEYRKDRDKFDIDDALSFESKNYNDEEFLFYFRITRDSFFYY